MSYPNIKRFIQVLMEFKEKERIYVFQIGKDENNQISSANLKKIDFFFKNMQDFFCIT